MTSYRSQATRTAACSSRATLGDLAGLLLLMSAPCSHCEQISTRGSDAALAAPICPQCGQTIRVSMRVTIAARARTQAQAKFSTVPRQRSQLSSRRRAAPEQLAHLACASPRLPAPRRPFGHHDTQCETVGVRHVRRHDVGRTVGSAPNKINFRAKMGCWRKRDTTMPRTASAITGIAIHPHGNMTRMYKPRGNGIRDIREVSGHPLATSRSLAIRRASSANWNRRPGPQARALFER